MSLQAADLAASEPWITMYDATDTRVLPTGPDLAYAGYVGGRWPTFHELQILFPGRRLLSIAVSADEDAECLDIENGDATVDQAPGWYKRQVARGIQFPVLYISAGKMVNLEAAMAAAGIARVAYRLWSAHYTGKPHLCSPLACGFGFSQADGTQWTDRAMGTDLDQSVLIPEFFNVSHSTDPAPVPSWEETMMNKMPTLRLGDKDGPGRVAFVGRMQALTKYIADLNNIAGAKDLVLDGDFGPATKDALEAIQHHWALAQDGVCGPKTWPLLVAGWSG